MGLRASGSSAGCNFPYKTDWLVFFLLLAGMMVLRFIPAFYFLQEILLNIDEREMTFTILDRFLGIPSTSLAWPAGTLQLLAMPVLAVDFLFQYLPEISIGSFINYLAISYVDFWGTLLLIRVLVVTVTSVGAGAFYFVCLRYTEKRFCSAFGACFLGTLPLVWMYSHMAVADGIMLAFACMSLAACVCRNSSKYALFFAGIFLGFSIAAKLNALFLAPFIIIAATVHKPWTREEALGFFLFVFLGFLLACPYIWVDPLRFAKSILGNVSRPGMPFGWPDAFKRAVSVLTWPGAIFFLISLPFLAKLPKPFFVAVGLTFGCIMIMFAKSSTVYDRYFLPIVLPAALTVIIAFSTLWGSTAKEARSTGVIRFVLMGLALLLIGNNIRVYAVKLNHASTVADIRPLVSKTVSAAGDGPLYIPLELLYYFSEYASAKALSRQASEIYRGKESGKSVRSFIVSRGLPAELATAVPQIFTEAEAALTARLRVMSHTAPAHGVKLQLYGNESQVERFNILSFDQVVSRMAEQKNTVLIVRDQALGDKLKGRSSGEYGQYTLVT